MINWCLFLKKNMVRKECTLPGAATWNNSKQAHDYWDDNILFGKTPSQICFVCLCNGKYMLSDTQNIYGN